MKMEESMSEEKKTCAHCGYTSREGDFKNDICPECSKAYWRCDGCGYLLTAERPPEICPSCNNKCAFKNVTCYTPECGGPGNIDPRL
jgi:rubrerythrin